MSTEDTSISSLKADFWPDGQMIHEFCLKTQQSQEGRECHANVVMAQAKRNYILIIKVNKVFSFFLSWCFLIEIKNMYSMFL